ncbi:hypothetical protein HPB48_013184 [Haemaphysalis longicornis]|uniref:Uncharacterized protein n=1 Tax=Haemaphysalis longicornis TaxID=44386 RepID=A0A9J6FGJ7_HAELO|nr:hypothetical protein HPB48_013184 [Haemaphysalis longicornis]
MAPRVPVEDRKLITRLFLEGLPQRVICQRTGRSKTAVSRIIRAIRNLADQRSRNTSRTNSLLRQLSQTT